MKSEILDDHLEAAIAHVKAEAKNEGDTPRAIGLWDAAQRLAGLRKPEVKELLERGRLAVAEAGSRA